ncbi:MAG: hypothetical protein LC799_03225 [Actinobacteria bacterium]|nr:hypothetical protein [Actinomycetota bacterium]
MIREDRELLAELARLNGDAASFALRIMDGTAGVAEQRRYAQRLIAVGERLKHRADGLARRDYRGGGRHRRTDCTSGTYCGA